MLVWILLDIEPIIIGVIFLIIAPLTQYFFYEIKNKNQYYYYYNLGLSNRLLWCSTFVIGIINFIILMVL